MLSTTPLLHYHYCLFKNPSHISVFLLSSLLFSSFSCLDFIRLDICIYRFTINALAFIPLPSISIVIVSTRWSIHTYIRYIHCTPSDGILTFWLSSEYSNSFFLQRDDYWIVICTISSNVSYTSKKRQNRSKWTPISHYHRQYVNT